MTTRANFQTNYLLRYLAPGVIFLFLAAWFAYDGFIGYPRQLPIAKAYDELKELGDTEKKEKWTELKRERGWGEDLVPPKKTAEELEAAIIGQYIYAIVCGLIGALALGYYARCRGSWVEATPAGLATSWGQSMNFDQVTSLNKRKWAEKGVAKAHYTVEGVRKMFVFDDFKFEREPLGVILRDLESTLNADQIVGGPPESNEEESALESPLETPQGTTDSSDKDA